jgi:hypothetical protein
MNYKARVETALRHEQPDQVPVDLGSTAVTGIHARAVAGLREHYGLAQRPVKVWEPYQFLGSLDDDLLDILGAACCGLVSRNTLFGFPNQDWKEFRTPWGQEVLVSAHFQTTESPDRGLWIYPQGDREAPPRGHMPSSGFFFDTIIRQEPVDENHLKVEDNLEEFAPVSDEELRHFRREAHKLAGSDRAMVATFGGTAFGDIALVPAPFLKRPRGIRDITEWYISTVTRRDYIHQVFSRQCEIALENLAKINAAVGDLVSVLFVCGTDFGTQRSQFCSPDTYESLWAPYYCRINDWVHQHTSWKTFKHCCGAVEPLLSHFIASGFDILNPVQISAQGMDPKKLKDKYGDRLVFWGGGVDTQKTLPLGRPSEVREEVLRLLDIFAVGGGYVFSPVHNLQANVPIANIAAMIEAVKEFNGEK